MGCSPASAEAPSGVERRIPVARGLTPPRESNSEARGAVDAGRRGRRISRRSETGTTETGVKAPKCRLSGWKGVRSLRHRGCGTSSVHHLRSVQQLTRRGSGPRRWTGLSRPPRPRAGDPMDPRAVGGRPGGLEGGP